MVKLLESRDTEVAETDHENVEEETDIEEILESLCQGENEFSKCRAECYPKRKHCVRSGKSTKNARMN